MGNNKKLTLTLIATLSISLLSLPVFAQSSLVSPSSGSNIPAPSVPVFTVQAIDSSSLKIIIQNQPFETFNESAHNNPVSLFYSVKVRSPSNDQWIELYDAFNGYPTQSDTQTTTIQINLPTSLVQQGQGNQLPVSSNVEVEITAMIGYLGRKLVDENPIARWVIYGETSGWSSPETVSLPTPLSTSVSTPTSTASITSDNSITGNQQLTDVALIAAVAVLGVAVVSLLVYVRRIKSSVNQLAK